MLIEGLSFIRIIDIIEFHLKRFNNYVSYLFSLLKWMEMYLGK